MRTEVFAPDNSEEISIKDIWLYAKSIKAFLKTKIRKIIVCAVIGGMLGFVYSYITPIKYIGKLTFVLEEEKSGSMGLSGAMGLASSLGIDLGGGASGMFSGANLIGFMKSRLIVEKALLTSVDIGGKRQTLADYYLVISKLRDRQQQDKLIFPVDTARNSFTFYQDSVLGRIYKSVVDKVFNVYQEDKKVGILTVETTSIDETFSKIFTEAVVKEVSDFYIDTKSKRAKLNYEILAKQVDSIRSELNSALTGVATVNENTFNLNTAIMIPKVAGAKRQVDVQANTAILTQLVANLEMAKVTLRKETPFIQIIDKPIFPLEKVRIGKIRAMVIGGVLAALLMISSLLFNHWRKKHLV
jgi:hypothetical protein